MTQTLQIRTVGNWEFERLKRPTRCEQYVLPGEVLTWMWDLSLKLHSPNSVLSTSLIEAMDANCSRPMVWLSGSGGAEKAAFIIAPNLV